MIAVDTNVLLRLLVGDDPAQAAKARKLFDRADAQHKATWVADTVLVEMVWTLARATPTSAPAGSPHPAGSLRR